MTSSATHERYGATAARIAALRIELLRAGMYLGLGEIDTAARLAWKLSTDAFPLIEIWPGAADVYALCARIDNARGDVFRSGIFARSAYHVASLHLKDESLGLWAMRELPAAVLVELAIQAECDNARFDELG